MQSDEKHRLELIGITYNQIESGVYALILRDVETGRRLPIIIGYPEAQAIECKLQEVVTPRPLTHDLMVEILSAFDLTLLEVNIRKLPNGVFAADLVLSDGIRRNIIDSRSSDAIALAVRVGAPIYTTSAVLDEAAYSPRGNKASAPQDRPINRSKKSPSSNSEPSKLNSRDMQSLTIAQLQSKMEEAVKKEDYETAARLKKILDEKSSSQE